MLKIIDKYILRRYLMTFFGILLLYVPVAIMINLAEKIGKIVDRGATLEETLQYYGNFTIVIGNVLLPILLFISTLYFPSRMPNNSKIVAILSSGISFNRFLRPYFVGASLVALLILALGHFIVPWASVGFNEFEYKYFHTGKQDRQTENIFNQLPNGDQVYIRRYEAKRQIAYNFTYEHFDSIKQLKYKISAENIRWMPSDSLFRLTRYTRLTLRGDREWVVARRRFDTVFEFKLSDLTPVSYAANTKNFFELEEFIRDQKRRGTPNINAILLVKYKRWSIPVSAYILTLIAVSVSSEKRRGGLGINMLFGVMIGLIYVFFDKLFSTMAQQSGFPPWLAAFLPNVIFLMLAVYMVLKSKK
jgi:lipopolysaccharide export system permease protein